MKKIILLIALFSVIHLTNHAQLAQYHIMGNVEVAYKQYDLSNFIGRSEYAELLLVINKNQQELMQSGPTKNNNLEFFTLDKFHLNDQDTLHINCWDMDKNSIWLLYLNGDDFICSFDIPFASMLDSTKYSVRTKEGHQLNMSINKYYTADVKILSYTMDRDIPASEKKYAKKGLYCKLEGEGDYTSTLVKEKKGKYVWNNTGTCFTYDGSELTFLVKTNYDEIFTKVKVRVFPGVQTVNTGYGSFEVEITPK
jgi:hypothetical protein